MKTRNRAIWLFGLSGAGKTTLSKALSEHFNKTKIPHVLLDGDVIRHGINNDLGFSKEDRRENVRRLAEISNLMLQVGIIPIVAAITPHHEDRVMITNILGAVNLLLVFVDCPLKICERRDPKGLYKRARQGDIKRFTGISDIFDYPSDTFSVETDVLTIEHCLGKVLNKITNG